MPPKKAKFVIQPFKHQVQMDPKFAEKTWEILKDAIHQIHKKNASGLSFEELYRNAYNMVLHKHAERLYSGLTEELQLHLGQVASEVSAAADEVFLKALTSKWQDHQLSMVMIRDILMYLDRAYLNQTKKTLVYDHGVNLFRDVCLRHEGISSRMLGMILDLIKAERSGDVIDRSVVKQVTQMLMELGRDVYEENFEKEFLSSSSDFFKVESQNFVSNNSCPDYLKKAESRIKEEISRVTNYLDSSTHAKLKKVVEEQLVAAHMKTLCEMEASGVVSMIRDNKTEDLGRMYDLFSRVGGGLELIRNMMGEYLKTTGLALVNDEENVKDPIAYTQGLLDLRDKCEVLLQAMSNDKTFHSVVNTAFEYFVNSNNRSPEFLSLYINDKLTRGLKGMQEDEVEAVLDKVMAIFRYIQEKDVFEKYYKHHLAKRLLSNRSVSDDAEKSLITKLKTECGYQFTSKLEGMFTDMKLSGDTMESFKNTLASANAALAKVDLSVYVLTTGYWPTQSNANCKLPDEVLACCDVFKSFYLNSHSGRRLTWQTNMGNADLRAVFPRASGKDEKHELNVSTYQMCILMHFNNAETITYKELAEQTEIPPHDLKRNLQSLACAKYRVLTKEPKSKEVNDSDIFHFNDKFNCKLFRVKIGTVAQKETEVEKKETRQRVDEDRKPQIEAAIVRIMKARKSLDHNNLVAEVVKILSSRFAPNPGVIKKRIESLIEREYLMRDNEDRRLYKYMA